jgi:hypothetical protein
MCGNIFVAAVVVNSCLQPFSLATLLAAEALFSYCRSWSTEGLREVFRGIQILIYMVKVKQSHYSPGQGHSVPGGSGSQISRQSAHEGDKVVSLRTDHLYLPGNNPGTHFC